MLKTDTMITKGDKSSSRKNCGKFVQKIFRNLISTEVAGPRANPLPPAHAIAVARGMVLSRENQ
jgi:hypothetical protein